MNCTEILHETANLTLRRSEKGKLEICLEGHTHAVLVGNPKDEISGRSTMEKLERYPKQLRAFLQHH